VAPIGFMLVLILWTILLTYSGHWILTASLIWMILFALIPFNHVKRAWLWNILIGSLIFIIALTFHLWAGSARLIDQQSRFLFREDRYQAHQTIHRLDQWTPDQLSVPGSQEFPFLYYSIPDDMEYTHRLPYPYYHFWMLNKSHLIQHDSLQQGIFYYENQPFYFMSQTTPQGHYILLPSIKKNYQYWLDRQELYAIRLDELRLITMLNYDFFTVRYREYHYNQRVESSEPESQVFPVRIRDLNPQKKLNQIMIKVQDYYLDGHWLAISYRWPDRYRIVTVWIKNYLMLAGLLLVLTALIKYAHSPELFHNLVNRPAYSSFLSKLIAVQSISLLLLMISLFYLTRESQQNYSLQQLEAGFIHHQQNFNDHFLQRVDFMERQLPRILDQIAINRSDSFHEETDSLSILYYLFDTDGRLIHHNFPAEWLDDRRLTELERADQPGYHLDMIHGQLFMLLSTPCRFQDGLSGKALLAAPITQAELEYLFDTKGIAFTFYLKERNILAETGLFFSRQFPMMIDFREYYRMLNNQSASSLDHDSHSVIYTAKCRLFSDDNLGLISFRVPLESPVLQTVYNQYFVSFILLTALAIIMIGLINRQLTRHLSQITDFIPSILENQPDRRLPIKGHDEFSLLSRTINQLSENLQREKEKTLQLEKERLVNQLAREIAHEIKNPLTPMTLSLQHLNDVYQEDPKQFMAIYPPIAQRLQNQIEILNQLSRKFLAVSRFEIGTLEPIDPVPILKELSELYNQNQPHPRISLRLDSPSGMILANRSSLNQLFVNLIKNGLEASPEPSPFITIRLRRIDSGLEILISDTGSGIPEELRQQIFLPYYTTKISGSGLGLTICKKIMDHLEGEISLEPNQPQGTTARLLFPLADSRNQSADASPDRTGNRK
ncbi:MAG: HAMP domain-containing histidine kinase, partial [Candidatus Delongbacteria bacterium]|nr:HAMP domain-containing histidine kinase [Candidatus Delongbacteria bacterium]